MDTGDQALLHFVSQLGLKKFYPNKLTLQLLLEINKSNLHEKQVSSVQEIPWCFLRNLFKIDAECRSYTELSNCNYENDNDNDNEVNPLDLIVALFLCADSFLQQEMALKMSMCQFSLPLLLPHGNKNQCSLMLWALRDIVKEWCPHNLSESKSFVEDNIIQANVPLYSFVRLKNCSLSKSHLLNLVLSRGQQNQNIFIHRDMEGGAIKREIANGLVEVCWYLPCGRENLDIFPEPVAFANLRGDICESLAQFHFLLQVSTATFVFLDKVEENEETILTSLQGVKSKLFLVDGSAQEDRTIKNILEVLALSNSNVETLDSRENKAKFSKKLRGVIKTSLVQVTATMDSVNMQEKATELGLSVDEHKSNKEKKAADKIMKKVLKRPNYKSEKLPLQGENWKRLAQLEKEECRLKTYGDFGLEEQKCKLQKEKKQIQKKQQKCKRSKGMKSFIDNISTDKEKRDFFLRWMKLMLNSHSRNKLSDLRNKYKEECKKKDVKLIAELDKALLESSLGIEHYMREMGLIYQFAVDPQVKTSHLPDLAAEMLLDGYPLELLDGDASNISEKWVTDVLMTLHEKVGGKSRLLVLTVLGVQSTGKSTLLNTMFGVQFPVSSGRCTRGAFMLFLRVGEDLRSELNWDFILLIDTEGLKSSHLAQLQDSYEHDNQLATFVVGLSDVTIVNIAMENATDMKDVLQITVHAFLRMKQIGKKHICHFVHQNVAGVSAHSKGMTERQHLLDQLNEMTQIAAEMEKQPGIKAFTDIMDYDIEKNNWNIPGLWHGTPPMAPVNTGYSVAVAHFKKSLLETLKGDRNTEPSQIPEFLEWVRSLWKAVKYENFIFSFRNTLVAHAYDNLCKEFNQWEWKFTKEILNWLREAELEILNEDNETQGKDWIRLLDSKKSEVCHKIAEQQTVMKEKLDNYYKNKDKNVNLIEKYKADFTKSITGLTNEIKQSVSIKLDCMLDLKMNTKKAEDIQKKYRGVIEEKVMKLLSNCKDSKLSDQQLEQEFEKMWGNATADIGGLKERDIAGCVLNQLRKQTKNMNVNEELENIDLKEVGKTAFKTKKKHTDSWMTKVRHIFLGDLQTFSDSIIESCTRFILDKVQKNEDYHDSFIQDLLKKTDECLSQRYSHYKTNKQFEIDLKLHICGIATREFLKMHQKFLSNKNPKNQLQRHKSRYLSDFQDLYKQKDLCQRKAADFVRVCLKPAVENYITRSLGIDIVDEILTGSHSAEYSSRSFFQYNIQKELLQKGDFQSFLKYIGNYEIYVKDWIFQHIQQKMSEQKTLYKLMNKNLQIIFTKITEAMEKASKGKDGDQLPDNRESIRKLISNMRKHLIKDISISVEDEKATLFQIQSTCHPFVKSLETSIENLNKQLQEEFSNNEDITEILNKLPIKPQDELFKRVFGCGKRCPFCKVPCEAGGKDHKQHHAAVHRPLGLGRFSDVSSNKLRETLCTTEVNSDQEFRNADTNWKWRPYKDYTKYYPDWQIPPDSSIEASDYWKYVLVQYNDRFAKEYGAKPADVPQAWRNITKEKALNGLKEAFKVQ